jgi:hypothetical protein
VHFALSILAVAMIFTLLAGREYDSQKAWIEAAEIRDLSENWATKMSRLFDGMFSNSPAGRFVPITLQIQSSAPEQGGMALGAGETTNTVV